MTPTRKRKTNEADSNAPGVSKVPKAATLLAQAPAAVRATITVLANSPVPAPPRPQSRPRHPPVAVPAPVTVPEAEASPEHDTPSSPPPMPETEPEISPESDTAQAPTEPPAAEPTAGPSSRKATRKKSSSKRKTLTTKGKRAVVLKVLASVEAQRTAAEAAAAAAAAAATNAPATNTATGTSGEFQQVPPEAKKNLGKAWSKEDLAKLARLAEEKDFLIATIPEHPEPGSNGGELDWELISSHFGRFSKGGVAVRQQYYAVVRMMKQARGEGKNGSNYADLVKQALTELPEQRGTVYEIHAVLKKGHAKHLDKYKVKGQVRWKKAVGEVLRQETSLFEKVEKTESGKIIWRLKS